ncbi:hypothetical protein XHC_3971 [Xanthomonas hortorum pv. carotae str. M081]|nr:hypothetical protein XHC_3971 [Xanthomonas hortorum pv. carotae str. M081]
MPTMRQLMTLVHLLRTRSELQCEVPSRGASWLGVGGRCNPPTAGRHL